jgi:hypothetical protein
MGKTSREEDEARLLDLGHRHVSGATCAVCGVAGRLVATRLIEYTGSRGKPTPSGFVPHREGVEMLSGGLAVCEECAPPCRLCHLPVPTKAVMDFYKTTDAALRGALIEWGGGRCRHSGLRRFVGL